MSRRRPQGPIFRCGGLFVAGLVAACGARIEGPDSVVRAYVDAVDSDDWGRAYRLLEADAVDGMTVDEYRAYCRDHEALVRERADAIRVALDRGELRVVADVPVDRVRSVRLEHERGSWRLAEGVPLARGADTPTASLAQLAAVLDSAPLADLLSLLSDEMRTRYTSEIDTLLAVIAQSAESTVAIYGDSASVTVGEITIRLVRESGAWHVSSVEQPYGFDDDYYYEGW